MTQEADKNVVESCGVGDLSDAERSRCLQLIANGGAVSMRTARRAFPRSTKIAVARMDPRGGCVASIKPIRESYAACKARQAQFPFDPQTPELGYVFVQRGIAWMRRRGDMISLWIRS